MASVSLVNSAFENIAAHITNLSMLRDIMEDILSNCNNIEEITLRLEERKEYAEVTLRTDIQILVNEILALLRK